MAQKWHAWFPVIIWMGIIFIFSSISINHAASFSWGDFILKKSAHVTEYAILYWLVWRAKTQFGRQVTPKAIFASFLISLFYAFSDEWHQTLTPGREGTFRDIGFDTIGILLALNWLNKSA